MDLKSAIFNCDNRPLVLPYIAGVGGRDVTIDDQIAALKYAMKVDKESAKKFGVKYVNFHK